MSEGRKVKLTGLTQRQVDILDMMWTLDSIEEMQEWFDSLDSETMHEALVLRELILLEVIDQTAMYDLSLAKQVIESVK